MSIEIITTVAGSAVFFLLFTVSLGFWGRLLLRALGIKEENGYGSPLPLVATIATLALVLRYVFYLTHNFDLLFSLIFILGLLGFVVELLLYLLKGLKPDIEKHSLVSSFTEKHSLILTGLAVCVVCSAYMCLIWPSRTMEPWLSNHMDFYYWIFSSDYWRGLADATIGSKYGYQNWPFDSFGAFILFSFFASAKGGQTFMAAPYFLVTLLSWIGICAYSIIRSVFRLPRIVALLLALGLVGGNFFNYIILKGYFGHIVGLVGFLTCLTVVFSATSTKGIKESAFVLFFPILYLFVCYQAVFVVFVSMVF
ncbi:MAG: hypothetical protein LBF40_10055, partial [Deltaproteobacteria bacterium]|nr:hypothetical protein [Deltaproteobacteria bacterium]